MATLVLLKLITEWFERRLCLTHNCSFLPCSVSDMSSNSPSPGWGQWQLCEDMTRSDCLSYKSVKHLASFQGCLRLRSGWAPSRTGCSCAPLNLSAFSNIITYFLALIINICCLWVIILCFICRTYSINSLEMSVTSLLFWDVQDGWDRRREEWSRMMGIKCGERRRWIYPTWRMWHAEGFISDYSTAYCWSGPERLWKK